MIKDVNSPGTITQENLIQYLNKVIVLGSIVTKITSEVKES